MKPIYKLLDWIDINKLDFFGLSLNEHDKAIELLEEYQDKIDWIGFTCNKNDKAIDLFKQNLDKINWGLLSNNNSNNVFKLLEQLSKKSIDFLENS